MDSLICIVCPNGCNLKVEKKGETYIVEGAKCKKGEVFALEEMTAPKRSISSTVKTIFPELVLAPVRTDGEILKKDIFKVMKEINKVILDKTYSMGEVVILNVADTGINIICTIEMNRYIKI